MCGCVWGEKVGVGLSCVLSYTFTSVVRNEVGFFC